MSDKLRIAVLAPAWFAVPPTGYGGIELVVSLLADGLVDAGHDVTLFASGDSRTRAKLVAVYPEAPSRLIGRTQPELLHVLSAYARADDFDVINDHTGMLGAVLGAAVETLRQVALAPDLAGELGHPPLCVVDVPLHLDRGDRRGRKPPVREPL